MGKLSHTRQGTKLEFQLGLKSNYAKTLSLL